MKQKVNFSQNANQFCAWLLFRYDILWKKKISILTYLTCQFLVFPRRKREGAASNTWRLSETNLSPFPLKNERSDVERYKYYKIDDSQTSVLPLCTNINTYLYSWIDGISKEGRKERIRIAARKEKNRDWTLSKQDCRGTRFVFSKLCIII